MLIGLCGYAGSGKDTVAGFLLAKSFERVAYGDALKEMALAIDPYVCLRTGYDPHEDLGVHVSMIRLSSMVSKVGWDRAKRESQEVRRFLQHLGTDAVRNIIGPNTWAEIAEKKISESLNSGKSVVITDVRFPNEANRLKEMGGYIVRIKRALIPGSIGTGHASESSIDLIEHDYEMSNDGSLEDLEQETTLVALKAHEFYNQPF